MFIVLQLTVGANTGEQLGTLEALRLSHSRMIRRLMDRWILSLDDSNLWHDIFTPKSPARRSDARNWHGDSSTSMPWLVPWTWCSPLCTAIGHVHEDIAVLFRGSPGIALPPSPRQSYPLSLA